MNPCSKQLSILLLIVVIYITFRRLNPASRQLRLWRRQFNIQTHLLTFQTVYADQNGFILSQEARKGCDALEYTYGEIDFESFVALLSRFKPDEHTIFYDLGSGIGTAVVAAAMVFKINKSCGIELHQSLHECAKRIRLRLGNMPEYSVAAEHICFINNDFLQCALGDASLVFINATAFFGDFWLQISHHLEHLPTGAIVLSTSKKVDSKLYSVTYNTHIKMSWGTVKVYAQQRL
ncbi:MAG: hypothetical protein H0U75_13290 [Legionella sp.]|nr:hypothetical protein [Legionella sp.]